MSDLEIKKGIPFKRRGMYTRVLRDMCIGDSVFLPTPSQRAAFMASAWRLRIKCTSAQEGDGFRIWKISDQMEVIKETNDTQQ